MNIAVLLSGGIGTRLSSDIPKQYIRIGGRMIITYCLEVLCDTGSVDVVHIVADSSWHERIMSEVSYGDKITGFSLPGDNRQLSILNALRDMEGYAGQEDMILVQDAVRPLASCDIIEKVLKTADTADGCLPVIPMKDTVYFSEDGRHLSGLLERSKILAGQAPEAYRYGKYKEANERLSYEEIMSLTGAAEPALMAGMNIATVAGDEGNFKITTDADLKRYKEIAGYGGV